MMISVCTNKEKAFSFIAAWLRITQYWMSSCCVTWFIIHEWLFTVCDRNTEIELCRNGWEELWCQKSYKATIRYTHQNWTSWNSLTTEKSMVVLHVCWGITFCSEFVQGRWYWQAMNLNNQGQWVEGRVKLACKASSWCSVLLVEYNTLFYNVFISLPWYSNLEQDK